MGFQIASLFLFFLSIYVPITWNCHIYSPEEWWVLSGQPSLYSDQQTTWPANKKQNKTKQANKKTPPHNQVKNYWQRKSCCIIVNVLRCQNMKGQEGFNTMALFSWMFLSRFFRLWESSSSSLSSSSSSSFSSSCFCFTFCLPLDICEGDFPLTGFLTLFSCVSFLGEDTLLTGNLRRKFSKKKSLFSNHRFRDSDKEPSFTLINLLKNNN